MAGLSRAVGEVTRLNMLWRILFDTMYVCMHVYCNAKSACFFFFLSSLVWLYHFNIVPLQREQDKIISVL